MSSISLVFLKKIWCEVSLKQFYSSNVPPTNFVEMQPANFQQQKLVKAIQEPIKIWLEGTNSKDLQFLQKHPKHVWNLSQQVKEVDTFIIIYIDFGTTEVRQIHMISGLLEKFHSQTQCDVNFKFKGGQSIGAHIIILSAASPVFTAMFQYDLKESQTHEVIIEDIDFQVFIHFLEYLYSCRISKLAKDEHFVQTINSLCQAADKYFVEDLKHECAKLLSHVDDDSD
jgi:hypothetical protein